MQTSSSPIKTYFSKQLSQYDNELTFDQKLNKILQLHKKVKIFTKKELKNLFFEKAKNTNKDFSFIESKINNKSKSKYNIKSFSPMDIFAKEKRISYLPKISPYILNNKSSIIIDYNKASEMGSDGFKILCYNGDKSIKEILFAYNDHNFKSLKDFNSFSYFNKVNENFDPYNNLTDINDKENLSNYNNKIINSNNNTEINNIFDKNFMKKKQKSKLKKLLKNKIERIKKRNIKVNRFYEQYHKQNLKYKNNDKRIYKINYNSVEKHTPYPILNSNSQRTSLEDMIQTNYSCCYIKKNNLINKESKEKKEILPKIKKKKFVFSQKSSKKNLDKFYITNRNINLCSANTKNLI